MFEFGWTLLFYIAEHILIIEAGETGFLTCINQEPNYRYQVFVHEKMFFQCSPPNHSKYIFNRSSVYEKHIQWFFQMADGKLNETEFKNGINIKKEGNRLLFSSVGIQNSGIYICKMENLCLKILLDVRTKEHCLEYGQSNLYFIILVKNTISCPSISCHHKLGRSNITWYKNDKELIEKPGTRFSLKIQNGNVNLEDTYVTDSATYVCDYFLNINGSQWIVRAISDVNVGTRDTTKPPEILYPANGEDVEAELGKPFELNCRVLFGYERFFYPVIKWIKLNPDSKEEHLEQEDIHAPENSITGRVYIHTSKLNTVTSDDLNAKFICHAQNSVGNSTSMIKLVRKKTDIVFLVYILCGSVLLLLILLIGSGLVYIHWIEIVLLYRNYLSKDETVGDDKDFDAFVSYAKQDSGFDEEICEHSFDEERFATQFLPSVLEDKYNYKLCLLDRDILPGGAYVEDIVNIIKRSRRAIFILSQKYITGPSLFELQAAVTCTLEEDPLKLILIKFKPFKQPESLPHIVKKALNALPMVTWKGSSETSTSSQDTKFWNKVRYHMPVKKNKSHGGYIFLNRLLKTRY